MSRWRGANGLHARARALPGKDALRADSFVQERRTMRSKATNYSALDYDWDRPGPVVDRSVSSLALPGFPGSLGPAVDLPRGILWPDRCLPRCRDRPRGFQ